MKHDYTKLLVKGTFGLIILIILCTISLILNKGKEIESKKIEEGIITEIKENRIEVIVEEETKEYNKKRCRIRSINKEYNIIKCEDEQKHLHTVTEASYHLTSKSIGEWVEIKLPNINPKYLYFNIYELEFPRIGKKVYIKNNKIYTSNRYKDSDYLCATSSSIFTIHEDTDSNLRTYYFKININFTTNKFIYEGKIFILKGYFSERKSNYGYDTFNVTDIEPLDIKIKGDQGVLYNKLLLACSNTTSVEVINNHFSYSELTPLSLSSAHDIIYPKLEYRNDHEYMDSKTYFNQKYGFYILVIICSPFIFIFTSYFHTY